MPWSTPAAGPSSASGCSGPTPLISPWPGRPGAPGASCAWRILAGSAGIVSPASGGGRPSTPSEAVPSSRAPSAGGALRRLASRGARGGRLAADCKFERNRLTLYLRRCRLYLHLERRPGPRPQVNTEDPNGSGALPGRYGSGHSLNRRFAGATRGSAARDPPPLERWEPLRCELRLQPPGPYGGERSKVRGPYWSLAIPSW